MDLTQEQRNVFATTIVREMRLGKEAGKQEIDIMIDLLLLAEEQRKAKLTEVLSRQREELVALKNSLDTQKLKAENDLSLQIAAVDGLLTTVTPKEG